MMAQEAVCGTASGYNRHRREGERACAACRAANGRRVAAQRAAARKPGTPPVLVPHPAATVPVDGEAAEADRASELRWQAEQLREGIVWAVVNDPGKVAAMSRERRDTLAELEAAEDAAGAGASDAVGAILSAPLSLVPTQRPPSPGA